MDIIVYAVMQVGNLVNIYHFMLAESTQHDLSKRAIYSLSVVGEKSEKTAALQEEEYVRCHRAPISYKYCCIIIVSICMHGFHRKPCMCSPTT